MLHIIFYLLFFTRSYDIMLFMCINCDENMQTIFVSMQNPPHNFYDINIMDVTVETLQNHVLKCACALVAIS